MGKNIQHRIADSPALASLFLVASFVALTCIVLPGSAFIVRLCWPGESGAFYRLIYSVVAGPFLLCGAFLCLWLTSRIFNTPRSPRAPGVMTGLKEGSWGLILGATLVAANLMLLLPMPGLRESLGLIAQRALTFSWFLTVTDMLFVAFYEELIFRFGVFRYFQARQGSIVAFWVSALSFNLMHAYGDSSIEDVILDLLRDGFLYTAAYWLTGRLFVPIGLHLGNNVAAAFLLGKDSIDRQGNSIAPIVPPHGNLNYPLIRFSASIALSFLAALILFVLARAKEKREGRQDAVSETRT